MSKDCIPWPISTLILALLVSNFLSITFIPSLCFFLYRKGSSKTRFEIWLETLYEKSFGRLVTPSLSILKFSAGGRSWMRRTLLTLGVVVLVALSLRTIMPVIGRDLMPPMDTGIIKAPMNVRLLAEDYHIQLSPEFPAAPAPGVSAEESAAVPGDGRHKGD